MAHMDSFDKVAKVYFASVTTKPFEYKGQTYSPKPLHVAPHFFHDFTCHLGCAGCCSQRFSLDYIPGEPRPKSSYAHEKRMVRINGQDIVLYSKRDNHAAGATHCVNVHPETAACLIHGKQPFTCDFETLRFVQFADHTWLGNRPYGRGWNMLRLDGGRGAICSFPKTQSAAAKKDAIRKLKRLQKWATHAGLTTYLPDVIAWAQDGPYNHAVVFRMSRGRIVIGDHHA